MVVVGFLRSVLAPREGAGEKGAGPPFALGQEMDNWVSRVRTVLENPLPATVLAATVCLNQA